MQGIRFVRVGSGRGDGRGGVEEPLGQRAVDVVIAVVGERGAATIRAGVVAGEEARPGGGDVEERLEEVGELAAGSEGREGIAERLEVILELRALLRFEGIEPAAAGEEPVARVAGWVGEEASYQDRIK